MEINRIRCAVLIVLMMQCLTLFTRGQAPVAGITNAPFRETVELPASVPDPMEPVNRIMWSFNQGLMADVVKPTSRAYRFIVVKPVRTGISNFGRNLTYPVRLLNNLLQGKWSGACDESSRFALNTFVGLGGIFDPASDEHIPKSDADFGQTLGKWGWKPGVYLMLPIFGPSNERDGLGLIADTSANPLIYINPYQFNVENPLTYLGPYTYFNYGVMCNDFSDSVVEGVRFNRAEMDAYSELQYAWTFVRENRVLDYQVKTNVDDAPLDTLGSVLFTYKDPEFPEYGDTRSVLIPGTGRKLKFTCWMQRKQAPVVYIVPGLGGHRMSQPTLALAELAYKSGYSVVSVSSAFNYEFMENASTAALPAYVPADGYDLLVALAEIDRRMGALYPHRMGDKALMGYSMGALHTLYLASTVSTNQMPTIKFDRYVAIDTPIRLLHGMAKLDDYYLAPLEWAGADRSDRIQNTYLKVAALNSSPHTPNMALPFSDIESRFLIGMTFRFTLRDVIYSSQSRTNLGVLRQPISKWRRMPVYQEIMQYSYQDYLEKFVVPCYEAQGMDFAAETLKQAGDLRTYDAGLRANPNIRVIVNKNDFLLSEEDLAWLHNTFAPDQLTVFDQGGHLGNLYHPAVQKTIMDALAGLQPCPTSAH